MITLQKLPQLMNIVNEKLDPEDKFYSYNTIVHSVKTHRLHNKIMRSYKENHKENIFKLSPHNIKPVLPSIFNYSAPITLLKPCWQINENRLNNNNFTIAGCAIYHFLTHLISSNAHVVDT